MKIQFVSNAKLTFETSYDVVNSTLNEPKTLDSYDVNIFSLQDDYLWRTDDNRNDTINCINDFKSIKQMIANSKRSTNIIALPQNYTHKYWKSGSNNYVKSIELKDEIPNLRVALLDKIIPDGFIGSFDLIYENSETTLNSSSFKSAFCFIKNENALTKSNGGCKATTIRIGQLILTTLDLKSPETVLEDFIRGIGLDSEKFEIPQWLIEYKCFDDAQQEEIINVSNQEIEELNNKIERANKKIEENLKYKSILSTNGDELVAVVFEILEKTLSCDLSSFVDEGKQDFLIKKATVSFIGEIKGITSNVRSENVSQLDVHYQSYLDDLRENGVVENVKQLLIINPFRTKPITERDEVHEIQINLAKRNGSLIITTEILLKIFQVFQNGEVSSEKIISVFESEIGLLTMDAFCEGKPIVDNSAYKV